MPDPVSRTRTLQPSTSRRPVTSMRSSGPVNFTAFSSRQSSAASKRSALSCTYPIRDCTAQSRSAVGCQRRTMRSSSLSTSHRLNGCGRSSWISVTRRWVIRETLSSSSRTTSVSSTVAGSWCTARTSSVYPRATVIGVRSSCEASRTNSCCISYRRRSSSLIRCTSRSRSWRRCTCHTITPKMAAINGSSVHSSQRITPIATWWTSTGPVVSTTATSAMTIQDVRHVVKPYTRARLIHTKWNGTVSWPGSRYMRTTLSAENSDQATRSRRLVDGEGVAHMAYRLDSVGPVELAPQPAYVHVDHVASRVEGEAPDVGEQLVAAACLTGAGHQVLQEQELAQRQLQVRPVDLGAAPAQVQPD